jgi:hypothetical protein
MMNLLGKRLKISGESSLVVLSNVLYAEGSVMFLIDKMNLSKKGHTNACKVTKYKVLVETDTMALTMQ